MSIPTNLDIAAVSYNGVDIPLAGGSSTDTLSAMLNDTLTSFTYTGTATKVFRDFMRDRRNIVSVSMNEITEIQEYAFSGCDSMTSVSFNSATTIGNYAFGWALSLETLHLPSATSIGSYVITVGTPEPANGITVVLPAATTLSNDCFRASRISKLDLGPGVSSFPTRCVYGTNANNHKCDVLILRKSDGIVSLANATSSITFSNITIYVPSSLISSYQADTNWTTVLGRTGTTMTAIEGSAYDGYYADGTAITT